MMSRKFLASSTKSLLFHQLGSSPISSSSTLIRAMTITMLRSERREFSSSSHHLEEKKSKSIWGNIMEFVNTIRQGRKIKKVEEEMKKNYSKLVASALLESIREQKRMKSEVDQQFADLAKKMNEEFSDIKKEMNIEKIKSEMFKKHGGDMTRAMRTVIEEQYAKSGEKPSEEAITNMEKELYNLMSRNDDNLNSSTPNTPSTPPQTSATTTSSPSKFKQILEKEKAEKKK
ncbi:hypothetical protein C9374_005396 [Naegleria lovaniensis]|uniref:Uncharacterized protein n=1 Tax=Naegleria lovaniensis TaxID=51637 RepID=A0AA88GND1_NAELO|nr:uncharacterized protein C9374_005396 [Naegleria lovaniensis]KAG2382194.1 hypothetical protein C9374_005396 [Naegleria lovaniensis]